jgi:nicotinamidase-related amidase
MFIRKYCREDVTVMNHAQAPVVLQRGDALSVTDIQNDFLPGGALGVPDGDKVIPALNHVIGLFAERGLPIFFTRDWHPPDHCSFRERGGIWPVHCVQNTPGAKFSSRLTIPEGSIIISKAEETEKEEYSTFYGRNAAGHTERDLMKKFGVGRVFIGGLATDYCVLNSVQNALAEGYDVFVLTDAIQAVDVNPGDGENALKEMIRNGAKAITTERIRA